MAERGKENDERGISQDGLQRQHRTQSRYHREDWAYSTKPGDDNDQVLDEFDRWTY